MNDIIRAAMGIVACLVLVVGFTKHGSYQHVQAYVGDHFQIPAQCKNLALIGCTPNPTQYVSDHGNNPASLKNIRVDDFLDREYVRDSFERTFKVCVEQGVDHMIIAYLPIYFVRMRPVLGDQFVSCCRTFLSSIVADMTKLIEDAAKHVGYTGGVTLIIPPDNQLDRVPLDVADKDERIRYLIKQFPALRGMKDSALTTITIINNEQSSEDDMLISYLKYDYLYEKPLNYRTSSTGKKQFHKGKS